MAIPEFQENTRNVCVIESVKVELEERGNNRNPDIFQIHVRFVIILSQKLNPNWGGPVNFCGPITKIFPRVGERAPYGFAMQDQVVKIFRAAGIVCNLYQEREIKEPRDRTVIVVCPRRADCTAAPYINTPIYRERRLHRYIDGKSYPVGHDDDDFPMYYLPPDAEALVYVDRYFEQQGVG